MPGDDFWQFNIYAGYRFFHRRAEATLAVLNITNEDYQLNPLNIYDEFPQRRTVMARLRLNF
jgi:outer membrane receptor protein involved in Fe transport